MKTFLWRLPTLALLAGLTYASPATEPPNPFTPVKATIHRFACLGREIQLGGLLLPSQVIAAGRPVLSGPVGLVSEPDVLSTAKGRARVVAADGAAARWEWNGESAELGIAVSLRGECDGFCWYEITLTPRHPVHLRSLRLEIPRTKGSARYLHTAKFDWSNVSGGLPELGGKWVGPFTPYVWLGDEERGLAWCAESDRGWRLQKPKQALRVETRGESVLFTATLLDHEETLTAPVVLRFGLQASPVKPVSFARQASTRILHNITYESCKPGSNGRCLLDDIRDGGAKTVVFHDMWSKYFGQLTPTAPEELRALARACHQRGLRLLLYVGYGLARNAPEMQVPGRHAQWSVLPLIPWEPGYKPEFRSFDATCARSGWADWLVAGMDKLFTDFDLDGIYFDGTSEAWRCQNQAHGCGWQDDKGTLHTEYPLLAARQLMRRIADTIHRHQPKATLNVHMSSSLTLPTLAFCDSLWNGEQFESHTAAEKFEVPLPAFRTEFMGYAHGFDMEFLCYEKRPFTFTEAITLAWLHGVEVRPYPESLKLVSPLWRAMDQFGTITAHWQPYWQDSGTDAGTEAVKASAWTHPGKALLFISHLRREAATVSVHLDRKRLGLKQGALIATDALNATELPLEADRLTLAFAGMSYRLVEISSHR
jgi:hypothetical protein